MESLPSLLLTFDITLIALWRHLASSKNPAHCVQAARLWAYLRSRDLIASILANPENFRERFVRYDGPPRGVFTLFFDKQSHKANRRWTTNIQSFLCAGERGRNTTTVLNWNANNPRLKIRQNILFGTINCFIYITYVVTGSNIIDPRFGAIVFHGNVYYVTLAHFRLRSNVTTFEKQHTLPCSGWKTRHLLRGI